MSRLLITGGSSYLGQHLVPLALARHEVVYTYFSHDPWGWPQGRRLDVRDGVAVQALVAETRPEIILHLAGSNRGGVVMADVICQGAAHVARAATAAQARLIHLSTDVIFDGQHAPYREEDPPAPLHEYGRAKAEAERLVQAHADHVIVRTSLIYGLTRPDHGTEWVMAALQAGQAVTLFTDELRNPIWAGSLSSACLELAGLDYRGVLHVAGAQCLSRAAFGLKLLDYWGVTARATLQLGLTDPTQRPQNCCLDTGRAQRLLQTALPGVDEVLSRPG